MLLHCSLRTSSAAGLRSAAPRRRLSAVGPCRAAFVRGAAGGGAPNSPDERPVPKPAAAAADPAAAAKALAATPAAAKPASSTKGSRRRTTTKRSASDDEGGVSPTPTAPTTATAAPRGRSTSPGTSRRTRTKTATSDGAAAAADGPKRPRARSRSPASPTAAAAGDKPAAATPRPSGKKSADSGVIPVGFLTKRRVQYGLELAVVGESDALGAWDPAAAVPLRWCDGDVWVGSAAVPAASADGAAALLAYKYIVRAPDGSVVQWQPSGNRVIELAALSSALADAPLRPVPAGAGGVLAGVAVAVEDEFDGERHQLVKCVVKSD